MLEWTPLPFNETERNYKRCDDLLHMRTSERCLISLMIFSFVRLASSGPWDRNQYTRLLGRDLCRAAVLLRFASLSSECEPEINIQGSQ